MGDKEVISHVEQKSAAPATALGTDTVGVEDKLLLQMTEAIPNFPEMVERARRATKFEHEMTISNAVKLYPKAIFFSFILSLAVIMEGYDTALLGNFFAFPMFQKQFGIPMKDGGYQVPFPWQSGLQNGGQVGQILGLYLAGMIAERFGYKKTMVGALIMMICCIFVMFFAKNIGMLLAGEILCGIPWGAFQTITVTYAAEVSPVILRPFLTTYVNLCWVTGQFISTGVIRGFLGRTDQWAWRIPFAIQWVWPVPILIGVLLAPESPWWLVRHGKVEQARESLLKLTTQGSIKYDPDDAIALMVITNEQEKIVHQGVSFLDCFKGVDLRRTEVVCCAWMIQVGCGIWFGGNVIYFLEQVGFRSDQAFNFGLGTNAIGWLGTICSWWVMQHVGRRTLYVYGLAIMFTLLMLVGFLGIPSNPPPGISYASAALLLIFVFTYDLTVGPVCYCLVAELPSTRLRIKSAALARNCYNAVSIGANFLTAAILNPTAWDLKGKGAFIWAFFCGLSLLWTFFRLPEPKGRTPAELDVLFVRKIQARKFSKVHADPFRSTNYDFLNQGDVVQVAKE